MKARGVDSPDDGDALALTFAAPVVTKPRQSYSGAYSLSEAGWMGG
jgi:hypothetical protein